MPSSDVLPAKLDSSMRSAIWLRNTQIADRLRRAAVQSPESHINRSYELRHTCDPCAQESGANPGNAMTPQEDELLASL